MAGMATYVLFMVHTDTDDNDDNDDDDDDNDDDDNDTLIFYSIDTVFRLIISLKWCSYNVRVSA
jgi:hypothetical protein